VLRAAGYRLLLHSTGADVDDELEVVAGLGQRYVDGLMLCPIRGTPQHLEALADTPVPVVVIGSLPDGAAVDNVRADSPAGIAGIEAGDALVGVGGVATGAAVEAFWDDLGLTVTPDRAGYAARVLAAGRRDRPRGLTVRDTAGAERRLSLPSFYALPRPDRPPVTETDADGRLVVRFNDSLGDRATIAAFDAVMASARPGQTVVLDLRDTPSGGNTVVARAIMGWFVDEARAYQIHRLPAEERETGIARQWIEQVLPREGKRHHGPVVVRVGRWTGSMGEGLAIGLDALGARVEGGPMAGLRGAIYDHRLPNSNLLIKLPTERLYAVDGTPREDFRPGP